MSENEIFVSVGRRKTSVARARLAKGSGKLTVNDKPLEEYCYTDQLSMLALRPLVCTATRNSVDADINVKGGGPVGQAGANQPRSRESAPKDGRIAPPRSQTERTHHARPACPRNVRSPVSPARANASSSQSVNSQEILFYSKPFRASGGAFVLSFFHIQLRRAVGQPFCAAVLTRGARTSARNSRQARAASRAFAAFCDTAIPRGMSGGGFPPFGVR